MSDNKKIGLLTIVVLVVLGAAAFTAARWLDQASSTETIYVLYNDVDRGEIVGPEHLMAMEISEKEFKANKLYAKSHTAESIEPKEGGFFVMKQGLAAGSVITPEDLTYVPDDDTVGTGGDGAPAGSEDK